MEPTQHSTRKHALLSASGASRWLNCTPSARLEEKFQESATSIYAAEGTLAHEFGDVLLRYENGEIKKSILNKELKRLRAEDLYSDEMEDEVAKYVEFVMETFNVAKTRTKDAILNVEERLDFSHIVNQGFGTVDATIIADGVLAVIDLKYGKGIRVDADNNPQLMLYALGALRSSELLYNIHTVQMSIVQPRLDHISTFKMTVEDLVKWADEIVRPSAQKAYSGEGTKVAGEWCKWCKAKPMCRTFAEKNMELAKFEFRDPDLLTKEELLDVFQQQPMLVDWVKSVADHILAKALQGEHFPGYKVVEGRSNRRWTDEKEVVKKLTDLGFERSKFMVEKLENLTKVEKLLGKKDFFSKLEGMVIKPQGSPTLAPESDKRPAFGIDQAKIDFAD